MPGVDHECGQTQGIQYAAIHCHVLSINSEARCPRCAGLPCHLPWG
ncbi:hypothetical protein ACCUM_2890 [Candidatus Accumulibacter phosphatis]|uniref:Uncharacterized protein n=1 Tax=Candidatus Accumulibacter phosphatis TaxID=327160 RepID=A0A5S4EHQ1_9PROT|nr:hypothetical protein ACCUM_2890 [Candidatus Accumulibacter phosphatis]